jgi:hypothetical protein
MRPIEKVISLLPQEVLMIKKMILLVLALLPILLFAQEDEQTLAGSLTLYDSHSSQPFLINSDGGWMEIRQIYKEDFNSIKPPFPGTIRKWRVKTTYIDESGQNGQSTLQVKLRQHDAQGPVFTLPWTENASRWQEKSSNWFIPYDGFGVILKENAMLSVRLIAPPRSAAPGKIYKIELEAWDFLKDPEDFNTKIPGHQMAFSSPSELMNPINQFRSSDSMKAKDEAIRFSLDFVQSNIEGNLPTFYKSLSDNLKVLETGLSQSRYRVAPPATDLSGYTLSEYKRNYRYHIYKYDDYAELFPQWFEEGRRWSPDRNCYLFLGTEVLPGQVDFMKGENLVFMVSQEQGSWKIIALPE